MALRAAEMKEPRPPVAEPCSARLATAEMLPTHSGVLLPARGQGHRGGSNIKRALSREGLYKHRAKGSCGREELLMQTAEKNKRKGKEREGGSLAMQVKERGAGVWLQGRQRTARYKVRPGKWVQESTLLSDFPKRSISTVSSAQREPCRSTPYRPRDREGITLVLCSVLCGVSLGQRVTGSRQGSDGRRPQSGRRYGQKDS